MKRYGTDADQPENHSNWALVVCPEDNVVHIAQKPGQDHQPDMDYQED
jgi:hypothetical protein